MAQTRQEWFRLERSMFGLVFAAPAGIFLYSIIFDGLAAGLELWAFGFVALLAFPWSLIAFVIGFAILGFQHDPSMVKLLLHSALIVATLGVFFNVYFLARFYYLRRT